MGATEEAHSESGDGNGIANQGDILLVDDDVDMLNSLTRILKIRGHSVLQATDGLHAVELCKAHFPQVVVSDIQMPNLNGIEACRLIKRSCPNTAVVFMTGYSEFEQVARDEGALAVLRKPVDLVHLFEILEGLKETALGRGGGSCDRQRRDQCGSSGNGHRP